MFVIDKGNRPAICTAKSIAGAVSGRMIAMLSPLTVEDSCEAKQINLACPCPNPTGRCHALKA